MIRFFLAVLLVCCIGCAEHSYIIHGTNIVVNDSIKEPNKFTTFELPQFNFGSENGLPIDQGGFYVAFTNDSLQRYNFKGQFYIEKGVWSLFDLEQFESTSLIDSIRQDNIALKVYNVASNLPGYVQMGYGNNMRAVYGVKKENGLTVEMVNYSDLNQGFSTVFLLDKFRELAFVITVTDK